MKKYAIVFFALISVLSSKAQKDSLKKIKFSAIQADVGTHFFPDYKQLSREEYKSFVKTNSLLNADVSNYKTANGYLYSAYEGLFGIKFYATIQDNKKFKKEVFIGLRYGQEGGVGLMLSKSTYDTLSLYSNSSGETYYKVRDNSYNYNYGITSQKLILPIGFNFTSNKEKRAWISYGVELSPYINFNYVFQASYGNNYSDLFVKQGDSLTSPDNLTNSNRFRTYSGRVERTNLSGVGYGAYLSLPFCFYMHPFLKTPFLKHINLMGSVSPGFVCSYSKFYGTSMAGGVNFSAGIRYNW